MKKMKIKLIKFNYHLEIKIKKMNKVKNKWNNK